MNKEFIWNTGINGFKENQLMVDEQSCNYTLTLKEVDFEPKRSIDDIFYDHLANRQTKTVELLYSGGADSELVLLSLRKNKIPFEVYTMQFKAKGILLNVTDMYYSERFCRENGINQKIFTIDAINFFESGKFLDYLEPYHITEPHVATHLWLIEQCQNFPIIGGDWPWVQSGKNVLSPFKLAYNSYERFMEDRGIYGIGNMLSHSFESVCYFINKQVKYSEYNYLVPLLKQKMYDMTEPRLRSYGWEYINPQLVRLGSYKLNLIKKFKTPKSNIIWGEKIKKLINSNTNSNDKFF